MSNDCGLCGKHIDRCTCSASDYAAGEQTDLLKSIDEKLDKLITLMTKEKKVKP